jgi:diadenosine tetraphosphate (Ap4A) HIT family hydrolase
METFDGTSSTITVQNGPDAGQTVSHVHVHVMPRKKHDFEENDQIYREIEKHDKDERTGRTSETMENEAEILKRKMKIIYDSL